MNEQNILKSCWTVVSNKVAIRSIFMVSFKQRYYMKDLLLSNAKTINFQSNTSVYNGTKFYRYEKLLRVLVFLRNVPSLEKTCIMYWLSNINAYFVNLFFYYQ
jgi:hypothetical protein